MMQNSKKTKLSRKKVKISRKRLLSNSRYSEKLTPRTLCTWYNDLILVDHHCSTLRTCARSRLTRRSQLHRDLKKCTKTPCINIRDNTFFLIPQKFYERTTQTFTGYHHCSTLRTRAQSRLTSRSQLPGDLKKCTKSPCINIRNKN